MYQDHDYLESPGAPFRTARVPKWSNPTCTIIIRWCQILRCVFYAAIVQGLLVDLKSVPLSQEDRSVEIIALSYLTGKKTIAARHSNMTRQACIIREAQRNLAYPNIKLKTIGNKVGQVGCLLSHASNARNFMREACRIG